MVIATYRYTPPDSPLTHLIIQTLILVSSQGIAVMSPNYIVYGRNYDYRSFGDVTAIS